MGDLVYRRWKPRVLNTSKNSRGCGNRRCLGTSTLILCVCMHVCVCVFTSVYCLECIRSCHIQVEIVLIFSFQFERLLFHYLA